LEYDHEVAQGILVVPAAVIGSAKVLVERETDFEKAVLFRMDLQPRGELYEWVNPEIEIIKSHPLAACVVTALQLDATQGESASATDTVARLEKTVKEFQNALTVANTRKSNIIEISYEANDPRLAATVVNQAIATYVNYRSELYNESESYKFFQEQISIAEEKLNKLEQGQAEFKQQREILSPQEQRTILLTRMADYEKSLTSVRTQRIGKEAKLAVIKAQFRKGSTIDIPATESSNSPSREKYIAKLKSDLLDMEIQRERLLQKFTPKYEEVVDLEKQIAATRAKIRTEIEEIVSMETTSLRALKAEEEALQASIDSVTQEISEFAQNEYEYSRFSRDIEDSREVYSTLLKQREEARISLAKLEKGVKIRIISPAVVPLDPIKPRRKLAVATGVLFGLLSGLGLAFVKEYLDHTVDSPADLEKLTGLPILGSVRDIQ
jgi:uncharacterized protein involved in exopolysaccharide biosynthesis